MTQQDTIEMIGEAGGYGHNTCEQNEKSFYPFMERFAKLVAEKEREACAQILANTDLGGLNDHPLQNWVAGMLFEYIKAIRARGKE